ncbi:MAG: cation-translocating P-type ATPase [Patescibacteria group bacterium]|nr:cation-translocating P-type ATPase [Patescibacteria group bacterium]
MEKKPLGLTTHEAQKRLSLYGKNILPHKKPIGDLILLFEQIKSPLIYILIIASLISIILGDFKDAAVILAAVIVNTVLGFYQERKAQHALYSLKQILDPVARVVRDGKTEVISANDLVPDDLVMLTVGDRVPADGRVIDEMNLLINESVLTGESVPVAKDSQTAVFMGTTIVAGKGKMIVGKTGNSTEIGKIAQELTQTHEEQTPLQKRINFLAKILAGVAGVLSFIVLVAGLINGRPFLEMFTTSVALAVAAIPEGMAVSLTAILAIGMQRILKRKALVRKLVAAEALGSTTVIATDKTGTLTEGVMSVVKADFTDKKEGLLSCALANNREDPLEIALWEYVQKNNLDPQELEESFTRISEVPFDAIRKFMAISYAKDKKQVLYIKGAPEIILEYSRLTVEEKQKWLEKINQWGEEGLRMIGLGVKEVNGSVPSTHLEKEVTHLTWLGLVGITDPVRETAKEAIEEIKNAGIDFKVITGDYTLTSKFVMKKIGINISGDEIIEGEEIEKLTTEELENRVEKTVLFARVTPIQKLRIVNALQAQGEVVALLGDGVNDAPAIKAADIGIVVEGATDVARQTADMVLLDSNFATIITAIEEGRAIYQNIKKVILYLLSDAFSEIILVFGSIILGLPLPLTAAQILWINLITDGLPNLALTADPKEKNLLKRPPIDTREELLDSGMKGLIFIISVVSGIFSLVLFILLFNFTLDLKFAQTIIFMMLGLNSLLYVFSVRTLAKPLWHDHVFSNKWLIGAVLLGIIMQVIPLYHPFFQNFLGIVPLRLNHWLIVLLGPILMITLIELIKIAIIAPKRQA